MTIALAAVLDTSASTPLYLDLKTTLGRGEALALEGSAVERVGLACLQVLAAGQVAARAAGLGFRIETPSSTLVEMAGLAGLTDLVQS